MTGFFRSAAQESDGPESMTDDRRFELLALNQIFVAAERQDEAWHLQNKARREVHRLESDLRAAVKVHDAAQKERLARRDEVEALIRAYPESAKEIGR